LIASLVTPKLVEALSLEDAAHFPAGCLDEEALTNALISDLDLWEA
jgi:hypothetical protein